MRASQIKKKKVQDIPIARIPKLHISTFAPYSFRNTTSGAIQYGVPTIVVLFVVAGSAMRAQKPKSATQRRVDYG